LEFERVCSLLLTADAGLGDVRWTGHADDERVAVVDAPVISAAAGLRLEGPVTVIVMWVAEDDLPERRLISLVERVLGLRSCGERAVVLTNLNGATGQVALERAAWAEDRTVVVWGDRELGESLDRHPDVRAAMPSVLGSRDLAPLLSPAARARSSLDVERAQRLARVFDASNRQVFVADDAFGSTEYRPDAAERWAQSLGRLLTMLDSDHWLIWTSRPAPLKAGLRRVQREHHSERFPAPGEVLVDASDLDLAEKTLILFRHAKARGATRAARDLVRFDRPFDRRESVFHAGADPPAGQRPT
jgi:hypothetical protein